MAGEIELQMSEGKSKIGRRGLQGFEGGACGDGGAPEEGSYGEDGAWMAGGGGYLPDCYGVVEEGER